MAQYDIQRILTKYQLEELGYNTSPPAIVNSPGCSSDPNSMSGLGHSSSFQLSESEGNIDSTPHADHTNSSDSMDFTTALSFLGDSKLNGLIFDYSCYSYSL